jgi:hypothetical protein
MRPPDISSTILANNLQASSKIGKFGGQVVTIFQEYVLLEIPELLPDVLFPFPITAFMPMGSNKVAAATLLTNVFLDILILLGYIGTSGVEILS